MKSQYFLTLSFIVPKDKGIANKNYFLIEMAVSFYKDNKINKYKYIEIKN